MVTYKNWLGAVRRRFVKYPRTTTVVLHTVGGRQSSLRDEEEIEFLKQETPDAPREKPLSEADMAAIQIQAYFRGHLARKAYRALKGLVKLQALVRGVCVRRQARIAMHCMHTLVRLQVRIRARQLLTIAAGDTGKMALAIR